MHQPEKLSKAESSRINGAQSRGPITDAGKARSSMNNLQHGMYSSRVILDNENPDAYHALSIEYKELFLPQDIFEAECVDNMINSRWLCRRMENDRTALPLFNVNQDSRSQHFSHTNVKPPLPRWKVFRHLDVDLQHPCDHSWGGARVKYFSGVLP